MFCVGVVESLGNWMMMGLAGRYGYIEGFGRVDAFTQLRNKREAKHHQANTTSSSLSVPSQSPPPSHLA